MNITMVTNAGNDAAARELLTLMGMPFKKAKQESQNKAEAKA
jgi:ribosomal protein L5